MLTSLPINLRPIVEFFPEAASVSHVHEHNDEYDEAEQAPSSS